MLRKLFLLLIVTKCIVCPAVPTPTNDDTVQQITTNLLSSISDQNDQFWDYQGSDENIGFSPLNIEIVLHMSQIKLYYEGYYHLYYTADEYLKKAHTFSKMLYDLQDSSDSKVKSYNALFYDAPKVSKDYVDSLKTYFRVADFNISFALSNAQTLLNFINNWTSSIDKGREPKLKKLPIPLERHMTTFEGSILTYIDCWDKAKTLVPLKFINQNQELTISMFNAKETVGYYNNVEKKYEAIRLPLQNGGIVMTILLPHRGETLTTIKNLEASDYVDLFENVEKQRKNVDFTVPRMNLTYVTVNENGVSLNNDYSITCTPPETSTQRTAEETNTVDYAPFYVDRPFGFVLYQEKTKLPLAVGLLRNPNSTATEYVTVVNQQISPNNGDDSVTNDH